MIKQLQKYSDLGTPKFLSVLLDRMLRVEKKEWQSLDLQQLFINQRIDEINNVTGPLSLLVYIGILKEIKKNTYLISAAIEPFISDESKLSNKFIELLFDKLVLDSNFYDIFSDEFISFDSKLNSYTIKNSAFGYKYSKLRQLLLDFDFITNNSQLHSSYLLNNLYKDKFNSFFHQDTSKRKISVDEFNSSMEQKRIYGEEAESFVVNFEYNRLNSKQSIEWVAKMTVNDGYDIASYDIETDKNFNRFIEVKSYAGNNKYFYLSANELKVSKRIKQNYWLYLVNRDKLSEVGYVPTMIQNPYEIVFTSGDWEMEAQNWKFEEIK